MADFAAHSFCDGCGAHRRRQPFGGGSAFFDRNDGPCHRCGEPGPGHQHIATRARVGRHWWQRGWVDRDGRRVDVPKNVAPEGLYVD